MLGAYSGLIDIFVNYYDIEARCAIFNDARFLIKMISTSQTALSDSKHFSGRHSNSLFLCYKYFDPRLLDALALATYSNVRSNNAILILVT